MELHPGKTLATAGRISGKLVELERVHEGETVDDLVEMEATG